MHRDWVTVLKNRRKRLAEALGVEFEPSSINTKVLIRGWRPRAQWWNELVSGVDLFVFFSKGEKRK